MQLPCRPVCWDGRALLLQQGLFELSPGLVGKFQSHCPLVPHEDNGCRQRALSKQSRVCLVAQG